MKLKAPHEAPKQAEGQRQNSDSNFNLHLGSRSHNQSVASESNVVRQSQNFAKKKQVFQASPSKEAEGKHTSKINKAVSKMLNQRLRDHKEGHELEKTMRKIQSGAQKSDLRAKNKTPLLEHKNNSTKEAAELGKANI